MHLLGELKVLDFLPPNKQPATQFEWLAVASDHEVLTLLINCCFGFKEQIGRFWKAPGK